MHLKVTVEEGRKAELKQQSLDAHSVLWVFLREDTLLLWSKEESLLKGIHLNKAGHGMSSGRSSKVRETVSWLAACLEHKWNYFLCTKVNGGAELLNYTLKLQPHGRGLASAFVEDFFFPGRGFYASDS